MLKPSRILTAVSELQCHDLLRETERSNVVRQTATTASARRISRLERVQVAAITVRAGRLL